MLMTNAATHLESDIKCFLVTLNSINSCGELVVRMPTIGRLKVSLLSNAINGEKTEIPSRIAN